MVSDQFIQKVTCLENELGVELSLGLSGSRARGNTDEFSDVDICIFVGRNYPSIENRRTAYATLGLTDPFYFDVDFDTSRGDGFIYKGTRIDFNWMVLENVRTFLAILGTDFDCPEWLPGGLKTVKVIHDPGNVIIDLQSHIPVYPIERSRYKVQQTLQDAHFSLFQFEWLPKAAHRRDIFSFLKNQYLILEKFFYTIFALNRNWYSDEKWLAEKIMDFEFVPYKANKRIQSLTLHRDGSESLRGCLGEIKSLFRETVACAYQVYPDLDLPTSWE